MMVLESFTWFFNKRFVTRLWFLTIVISITNDSQIGNKTYWLYMIEELRRIGIQSIITFKVWRVVLWVRTFKLLKWFQCVTHLLSRSYVRVWFYKWEREPSHGVGCFLEVHRSLYIVRVSSVGILLNEKFLEQHCKGFRYSDTGCLKVILQSGNHEVKIV